MGELDHGSVWCENCLDDRCREDRAKLETYMRLILEAAELRAFTGNAACAHACVSCERVYTCTRLGIQADHVLLNRQCLLCELRNERTN